MRDNIDSLLPSSLLIRVFVLDADIWARYVWCSYFEKLSQFPQLNGLKKKKKTLLVKECSGSVTERTFVVTVTDLQFYLHSIISVKVQRVEPLVHVMDAMGLE